MLRKSPQVERPHFSEHAFAVSVLNNTALLDCNGNNTNSSSSRIVASMFVCCSTFYTLTEEWLRWINPSVHPQMGTELFTRRDARRRCTTCEYKRVAAISMANLQVGEPEGPGPSYLQLRCDIISKQSYHHEHINDFGRCSQRQNVIIRHRRNFSYE
eukprot:1464474-Pleurochrysis_carterae.AAC.1